MPKKDTIEEVEKILLPIIEKNNFELVDVEYIKEGKNWYLRIYIDKDGGIGIDDCQFISKEVSPLLDSIESLQQAYNLEVSSPGLDRPLKKEKDFIKYKGEEVEVKLFKPVDKIKVFVGVLTGIVDDKIVISNEKNEIFKFDKEQVALVKRVIKF